MKIESTMERAPDRPLRVAVGALLLAAAAGGMLRPLHAQMASAPMGGQAAAAQLREAERVIEGQEVSQPRPGRLALDLEELDEELRFYGAHPALVAAAALLATALIAVFAGLVSILARLAYRGAATRTDWEVFGGGGTFVP